MTGYVRTTDGERVALGVSSKRLYNSELLIGLTNSAGAGGDADLEVPFTRAQIEIWRTAANIRPTTAGGVESLQDSFDALHVAGLFVDASATIKALAFRVLQTILSKDDAAAPAMFDAVCEQNAPVFDAIFAGVCDRPDTIHRVMVCVDRHLGGTGDETAYTVPKTTTDDYNVSGALKTARGLALDAHVRAAWASCEEQDGRITRDQWYALNAAALAPILRAVGGLVRVNTNAPRGGWYMLCETTGSDFRLVHNMKKLEITGPYAPVSSRFRLPPGATEIEVAASFGDRVREVFLGMCDNSHIEKFVWQGMGFHSSSSPSIVGDAALSEELQKLTSLRELELPRSNRKIEGLDTMRWVGDELVNCISKMSHLERLGGGDITVAGSFVDAVRVVKRIREVCPKLKKLNWLMVLCEAETISYSMSAAVSASREAQIVEALGGAESLFCGNVRVYSDRVRMYSYSGACTQTCCVIRFS